MAFRLSEYVIGGFVINKGDYSTFGRLALRGLDGILMFELTGFPADDLRDKRIEFEVPENDRPASHEDIRALAKLKARQIGATGSITAVHRIRAGVPGVNGAAPQEELGLFMEWFSQDGRVVIELPHSKIRFLTDEEIAENDRAEQEAFREMTGKPFTVEPASEVDAEFEDPFDDFSSEPEAAAESEGYNLIPDEFEREMERKARQTDREVAGVDEQVASDIRELELLDEMMEGGEETPIDRFLEGVYIPPTSSVHSDTEAEAHLKPLLARLALLGIKMDTCEHCTPQNAYRLLVDKILPNLGVYEPLLGSSMVHHVCAYEHCEQCLAELESGSDSDDPPF